MFHNARRNIRGIAEKCAQEAHSAQLQRETEPVVFSAPDRDQSAIGIVQVEIPRQLRACRLISIAAITLGMFVAQKSTGMLLSS